MIVGLAPKGPKDSNAHGNIGARAITSCLGKSCRLMTDIFDLGNLRESIFYKRGGCRLISPVNVPAPVSRLGGRVAVPRGCIMDFELFPRLRKQDVCRAETLRIKGTPPDYRVFPSYDNIYYTSV